MNGCDLEIESSGPIRCGCRLRPEGGRPRILKVATPGLLYTLQVSAHGK
jgi:hypothetical protein